MPKNLLTSGNDSAPVPEKSFFPDSTDTGLVEATISLNPNDKRQRTEYQPACARDQG
jgi:hypothetical protein